MILPLAEILPVVEMLVPLIAPACVVAALTPVDVPTARPPVPIHDILLHVRAPPCVIDVV